MNSKDRVLHPLTVLNDIISNEMCVGCGVCTTQTDTADTFNMQWDERGFLVPNLRDITHLSQKSIEVCPFNPYPADEVKTEDQLADIFLSEAPNKSRKIGHYYRTYVGYAEQFRLTSSSGGIASYITYTLLKSGFVNAVLSVTAGKEGEEYYTYNIITDKEQVLKNSKTRYFPVSMSEVLKKLPSIEGKVAIVGIPCFIKSIRLNQYYNPELKDKIAFLIGIVCGGMKSRFFSEYLASKAGVDPTKFSKPAFREKDLNSYAMDYSFSCEDEKSNVHRIKMSEVGDMWGTGFFKNNACDFCDDVAAELADISLGDAWIDPYNKDGAGTNVIITRSALADQLIREGVESGKLLVESLKEERFIQSQQGGYNHRHTGMKYRIRLLRRHTQTLPPKRLDKQRIPFAFQWVQRMRVMIRKQSLELWQMEPNAHSFDRNIRHSLEKLRLYTRIYHAIQRLKGMVYNIVK